MSEMTLGQAIHDAIWARMEADPTVIIFGEDVGQAGGDYGISNGMNAHFGNNRCFDTPISESGFIGAAVGAALTGLRPIPELMINDFMTVCMDPLVNQAAKMRYMFGGKTSVPMVVRMAVTGGTGSAAQHSQSLEAWLCHVPGLKVVYPSNPQDAYGLMLSAIDDDDPVMFFEPGVLYAMKGEVSSLEPIPLGKGRIAREGSDLTIVSYGFQMSESLKAAELLAAEGISAEVVDIRTLFPLDKDIIAQSVAKTHKVIVSTQECKRGSYAGELSATISEEMFDMLDCPVVRVTGLDTPIPFAPNLESYFFPKAVDIVYEAKKML